MSDRTRDADWTAGPAKWAAVVVLGAASVFGIGWSIVAGPVSAGASAPSPAVDAAHDETDAPSIATLINVNEAGAAELELLPRIGPALAGRIIEERETNGLFGSLDELERVHGIGPKTVEKLRPHAEAK